MNNINIEARFLALKTELTLNTTGRRRKIIIDELNKLATSINEKDKNDLNKQYRKHQAEIADLKNDYDEQIMNINKSLTYANKELIKLNEANKMNKLKAQNTFKKLNARLTPSEFTSFSDGLAFIRLFV